MKFIGWILFLSLLLAGCGGLDGQGNAGTGSATATPGQAEVLATVTAPARTPTTLPSQTPTSQVVQGTLTIWHSWNETQMPVMEEILQDFQAQNPDVLFDVLYIPQENLRTRFESAMLEGRGPDILLGPTEWGPAFYQAGLVTSLDELAGQGLLGTINPAALDGARYQQALVGLPYAQQGVVLYRNKALASRAATTFDELDSLAKAAAQGEIIGADLDLGLFFSGGHLQGLGGKLMNEDGAPAFNNERGLAWLELLKRLGQVGASEYQSDRDLELFKEGRVGWIIDGTWNLAALSEALGAENLAIDTWPSYPGGSLAGYVQPANLYLSQAAQGDDRLAAWKFMEAFLSPPAQSRLNQVDLFPVVSGIRFADPRQEVLLTQALTALAGGAAYPVAPEMALYLAPLDAALQSVIAGNSTPAEALNAAEQAILVALAQAKATPTP